MADGEKVHDIQRDWWTYEFHLWSGPFCTNNRSCLCVTSRPHLAKRSGHLRKPAFCELEILFYYIRDIREIGADVYPCKAGGFAKTLDTDRSSGNEQIAGCMTARQVLSECYGRDFPVVDICPANQVSEEPFIARCCRAERDRLGIINEKGNRCPLGFISTTNSRCFIWTPKGEEKIMKKVIIAPGDGIGQEFWCALDVLRFFIPRILSVHLGYECWKRTGDALSARTLVLKKADLILFGAITTPPDPAYHSIVLNPKELIYTPT